MGLLDSVLGSVLGGQQAADAAQGGGLAGMLGTLLSNPQLLQVITGLLANDGAQGGLDGLMGKFQQAGLGDVLGSWVESGPNQPISGNQLTAVLGSDVMADLAARLGTDTGAAAGQLSQVLPGLIDQLTPSGEAPQEGLGSGGELMGILGGLLARRRSVRALRQRRIRAVVRASRQALRPLRESPSTPPSPLFHASGLRGSAPDPIADLNACWRIHHHRQAAVVANQVAFTAKRDETSDLGRVRIDCHQGARHRAQRTDHVARKPPTRDRFLLDPASEEVSVALVDFDCLANDQLDPEVGLLALFRKLQDVTDHPRFGRRKRPQVIRGRRRRYCQEKPRSNQATKQPHNASIQP